MTISAARQVGTVSLYERLGAAPGIERLVDGIVAAHMRNPVIEARFRPYLDKPDRVAEVKRHMCAFLAAGTGGPDDYRGRSMCEAHRGMNISEAEYAAASEDISGTMERQGYDDETREAVLTIVRTLKDEIIRV